MSVDFAQLTLCGRLTEDPEFSISDSGSTRCKFRVAVNRRISKDREKTAFIPVTVFGRDAENCNEHLSKGREVFVTGNFETDKYTDRNGIARTGFGVVAREVTFGSGGRRTDEDEVDEVEDFDSLTPEAKVEAVRYLKNNRSR